MGFNKIPLALGFNDATGNASGLIEFIPNLSDSGDVCNTKPTNHQVLAWTGSNWCGSSIQFPTGGTSFTCSSLSGCNLSALSNVCSNGPGTNDVLAWNGTKWCPSSLPNAVPPPLPAGSPGDILAVKHGETAFATSLASATLITNAIADQNILTTTNVEPPNVGMSSDGHMTFRTNATTFGTIASNANARTFLTTDANFENLTNVTGISDTDDIADGSPLFWSRVHGSFSAIMENDVDAAPPAGQQMNFLNLTASGGLTVEGDSVQKTVSSTSVTGIDIRAPGSVSSAGVSGVNGAITSAPTTGNHIANKTYVDGINNTQHNRLFAVGTKTDSIANTAVYLGWEFDGLSALSVSDAAGVITIGGTGNTEITFGAAGDYMIDCTARANADNRIELFVKGEYYDATEESPRFKSYNRLQNSNYAARDTDQNTGGTTLSLLLSLNQNDKLRFEAEADADGTAVLLVNGTFLRIVKLA